MPVIARRDFLHTMNSVQFLLKNKFPTLPDEDQIKIKELGRPTPVVKIEVSGSSRNKAYKRQFNSTVYANTKWICGCDVKDALFCFPCLLFGGDKSWTVSGFTDIGHLTQSIKRHEVTKSHLSNEVSLAFLANANLKSQLDSAYWSDIRKHNEQVTRNRYVLSKIIDCIKFCGAFDLPLHGSNNSSNPGVLRGVINFSACLDHSLREHLEHATVSNGSSEDLENELLQCMLEVCREQIVSEISDANYLAVMADETTKVASGFQMVIVLRYVKDGGPVERFWGFVNPRNHDTEAVAQCIRSVIDPLLKNNCNKLIAQAYDGVAVMSGQQDGVHARIKQKYPLAHFVHCYAHQLNLIMSQAAAQNLQVRIFLANVDDIVNFFSNTVQLEAFGKSVPFAVQPQNFKGRSVNVLYENRELLIECCQKIQDDCSNCKIINRASAIERLLKDSTFLFWLNIFRHIMPHIDVLYSQLQRKRTDTMQIKINIDRFEECINDIKQDLDNIIKRGVADVSEPAAKRMRTAETEEKHHMAALEVCDVLINTAKTRFEYTNHLVAATLFASECFESYSCNFPNDALKIATTSYPVLEADRLKTELSIIYSQPDFRDLNGALAFLSTLLTNNLEGPFKETMKLLEILLTIPMSTPEAERCFTTVKRIKSFLQKTTTGMTEQRLSALSMLSIEKSLVSKDLNFNEKVIEKFVNLKQHRVDLIYKK